MRAALMHHSQCWGDYEGRVVEEPWESFVPSRPYTTSGGAHLFERAASVAPDGEVASASQVGAAEARLKLGLREQALAELEAVRLEILAGESYGNAALLQRIAELRAGATD